MSKATKFPLKHANRCAICGKQIDEGEEAYGARSGPISRVTGLPGWEFVCLSCHSEPEDNDSYVVGISEEALADVLSALDGMATGNADVETIAGDIDKIIEPETQQYSEKWIKQHAVWGRI